MASMKFNFVICWQTNVQDALHEKKRLAILIGEKEHSEQCIQLAFLSFASCSPLSVGKQRNM
jgi:hypothetical protein